MLEHPRFLETRPWTLKTLKPFDRKAYIDALLSQYPAVPEEFRIWIMEWPARMVPFGMWPGSPFAFHDADHPHSLHSFTPIPALLSWKEDYRAHWLIFAKDEPELFGRVITTDAEAAEPPIVCRLPWRDEEDEYNVIYDDWLQFLESRWDKQLKIVLALGADQRWHGFAQDEPLLYPARYKLGSWVATTLPTHPWVLSCNDPQVLEEFQRLIWHD
ncbi:hypothetical protein CPC08DRAFT_762768 [Agrocybe pediades]|nr:hypothetical protein CPC08DRAFT_762768 [Agrocybe pediades]